MGVGPYGTLDFQGPSTIDGDLYLDPTLLPQDIISDAGVVTGTRLTEDLSGAVNDALIAAETNADRIPTQSFDRLSVSTTIYGEGGMNVIAIDGLDFAHSSTTNPLQLTLMGGEGDLFVLNINGKFVLGPNSSIRGVEPSQVLVNVLQGNTPVQFAANSYIGSTLLSTERKMGPLQGRFRPGDRRQGSGDQPGRWGGIEPAASGTPGSHSGRSDREHRRTRPTGRQREHRSLWRPVDLSLGTA